MTVAMIPGGGGSQADRAQQQDAQPQTSAAPASAAPATPNSPQQLQNMPGGSCGGGMGEKDAGGSSESADPDIHLKNISSGNGGVTVANTSPNLSTTSSGLSTGSSNISGSTGKDSSSSSCGVGSDPCSINSSEPDFPHSALGQLDEMIHRQRWVVPVLPECELELLLDASIALASKGMDTRSEACQRFFREGLTLSFTKILTDEAVSSWKFEIHKCILSNCEKLVELIVLKLPHDWFPLLELLAMLFNPSCKFHTFNTSRTPESIPQSQKQPQHQSVHPPAQQSSPQQDQDTFSQPQSSPSSSSLPSQQQSPQSDLDQGGETTPQSSGSTSSQHGVAASTGNPITALPGGAVSQASASDGNSAGTAAPALHVQPHERVYARPNDFRHPKGWLVDLINYFGRLGGFDKLLERFQSGRNLSVPVMCALLRPFGFCYEFLTINTIETFFMPIIDLVPTLLENLTDDELKKEAKIEAKNDALSTIIKAIKALAARIPSRQDTAKNLEIFRLKMILRLLQISSFNGKMNALNEVNKVINNVNYPVHRHAATTSTASPGHEEEDWLTAHRFAEWIKDNRVLQIVLRDSLHQPQYVEKLEKIIRFVIKERALSLSDLDDIWQAQHGKHEAIVKNVHDLLAKLAWDFSPEQLDHLFEHFQTSWREASKKQREKLLELIRRLAEDDKDGDMAQKVLSLLWSLARSADVPTEIMDQALSAHVKILDYSCAQERDLQKQNWLKMCVEELKHDKWVLPALKQIREIFCSYNEAPANYPQHRQLTHASYRHDVISKLQNEFSLVVLVTENLTAYMKQIAIKARETPGINPTTIIPDGRYNHVAQVQDRLSFLRFLLKDGQLWLCAPQAKQIWNCLAENAVFTADREACFKWFSKLMGDEPDLDPDINKEFFESNILQLDPKLLTEHGMRCFDRFFKAVNFKENKLVLKRRTYLMDDVDLIGIDYLWKVLLSGSDEMANRAIELLKETFTNLGPRLLPIQAAVHEDFINNCISRLKAMSGTVSCLNYSEGNSLRVETTRMCRVLKVLYEYVVECDGEFGDERAILPLARSWRGKHMSVTVRFQSQTRQPDEVELWTHTNDTVGSLRRQLMQRLKAAPPNVKVEMYLNNELMDPAHDNRVIAHVPLKDKMVLTGKLAQVGNNLPSSPDSSSDSSPGSPHHQYDGPNNEAENCLPGVLLARNLPNTHFLIDLADLGCRLQLAALRDAARALLSVVPADQYTVNKLSVVCQENAKSTDVAVAPKLEEIFFFSSSSTVLYNLQVLYSMLMPASNPLNEKAIELQFNFIKSGGVKLVIDMLTKNSFLSKADVSTRRAALLLVVKIAKLVFVTVGYAFVGVLSGNVTPGVAAQQPASALNGGDASPLPSAETPGHSVLLTVLQQALPHIPSSVGDCMIRSVAVTLCKTLLHNVTSTPSLWAHFVRSVVPDHNVVNSLLRIVWSSSAGLPHLVTASLDHIQNATETLSKSTPPSSSSSPPPPIGSVGVSGILNTAAASGAGSVPEAEDLQLCSEGLETLAVVLMLCPNVLEKLSQEAQFQQLVVYLVAGSCERSVRQCAVDQLLLIATKCASSSHTLVLFIAMLFNMLSAADSPHQQQPMPHINVTYTKEFFQLLCGLLSCACVSGIVVNDVEVLLDSQVLWLRNVARNFRESSAAAEAAAVTAAAEDSAAAPQTNNSGGQPHASSDSPGVSNDRAAALTQNDINSPSTSTTPPSSTLTAGSTSSSGVTPPLHQSPGSSSNLPPPVDHTLLEGHLCVTRELLAFLTPEAKFHIGGDPTKGICLIREIIEDFIFPFSKVYLQLEHSTVMPAEQVNPVCSTQSTVIAAYDLLVTLCTGCALNLTLVAEMLTRMFYSENEESLTEWDYMPAVGPRPPKGFVGLKNAGATCYMNSVLQQLYMIRQVREGVLCVEGAATDPDEDFSGEERVEPESTTDAAEEDFRKNTANSNDQSRKEYHIGILKQVQAIFAHLSCSKLQYYVPRGLWKHFKLQGEPVNLREQHDACEFYNILVESINEALKALGRPQLLNTYLGGSFSDQKICKTCPHRYSREEAFTVISIDIRNYSNLYDSLEQYVKGDLLEGDNAYLCEKCDKKVDTVKRICLKKLPPILAIQLKRFDYDWERETSVKFNDYFEFPRELDMDPYTVQGLARNGELIAYDESDLANEACSRYQLTGIVVHSGQASGGHYYSYIGHRNGRESKWYKFDDGEVTECRMDDDEEMKNQCFGGEYLGEQIFDNMMKRVSYRRQKRWWNAYLLFYTREDVEKDQMVTAFSDISIVERPRQLKMPLAMQRSVARQNVRFMHSRSQFSLEYFHFLKKLLLANHSFIQRTPTDKASEAEQVGLVSTKLASKFLFMIGLHTKKQLRGPAQEWYDALQVHLRSSARSRVWFVKHVLFGGGFPFSEYLLECPSPEVRLVFSKMVVAVAHSTRGDPPLPGVPITHNTPATAWTSLSDQVLAAVLMLVHRELADHTRHLAQYFHLFNMYAALGVAEKRQLLKLNVVENLMGLAVEEAPGPVIKYPCVDLSKLYQVASQLIRCCDVSMRCRSSMQNHPPLANPHGDQMCSEPLMPIQLRVADILYSKPTYIKKVIEEAHNSDDTVKLLKFCCWENPNFSSIVLSELLSQVGYAYTYEMRPFIDLLLHMLTLEDTWQEHRIHNALKGIQEEREGLLDVVHRSKNHYQKRAYQCVKCMVTLFSTCHAANVMLNSTPDLKQRFAECVEWLNEEMNRRPFSVGNQQYYNNWSPPAPSNETSNGYYLERSVSARNTLDKAMQMCPDEEGGDEEPDEGVHTGSAANTASDNNNRVSSGKGAGSPQQSLADDAAPASRTTASPTNTETAPSGGALPSQPTVTAQVEDQPRSGGGPMTGEQQSGGSATLTLSSTGDGGKTPRLNTTTSSSSSGVTKDSSSGPPGQ